MNHFPEDGDELLPEPWPEPAGTPPRSVEAIAHDVRNLLAVIACRAQAVLCETPADFGWRTDLDAIESAARSSATLIAELFAPDTVDCGHTSVSEVLVRVQRVLQPTFASSVRWVHVGLATAWPVQIEPVNLERVLVNLVINARDVMPESGALTISVANIGACAAGGREVAVTGRGYVRVSVGDTGVGLSELDQSRAFRAGFTTGNGHGLGLSVVRSLVRSVGGYVHLESNPGQGTRVDCYLPAAISEYDP